MKKNYVFHSSKMSNDDEVEIKMYKPSLFYSSYARLKPFLLSFQRKIMYDEVIKPALDKNLKIIRVKNDSIIVDKRIEEYDNQEMLYNGKLNYKTIGKMIFEKEYHNFKTINMHKFEF